MSLPEFITFIIVVAALLGVVTWAERRERK
jgi:hypothetical protein